MKTAKTTKAPPWRRYRIKRIAVAWQELHAGRWLNYEKQIPHKLFAKFYTQSPPIKLKKH